MEKQKIYGRPALKMFATGTYGTCAGCGHPLIGRIIYECLDELGIKDRTIQVSGVGCTAFISMTTLIDTALCTHGTAPAVLTGIKQALYDEPIVYAIQGDGDAAAIGAGALINAAVRGERITIIMANNANYGTTGGQMGPTTLAGQVTTTCPQGRDPIKHGWPVHTAEMLATIKSVAYSARGAVNSPKNFQQAKKYVKTAFQKQMDDVGFSFVEILDFCPTNWKMSPVNALDWVEKRMIPEFPLGEFRNVDSIV
ncbi:MAG: thiamine pyrophosphate-dependent enzyme [Dehalococcoidia bacterium]|nr:thiamine pyrophosphate-dependent enzyme [Dehalococcoidia bacterium]